MYQTLKSVIRFKPLEFDPVERRLAKAADVDDLRRIAQRRLPRGVFDYIDGGAEDERTCARQHRGLPPAHVPPPGAAGRQHVDPSTTLLGRPLPLPLVLAPTGFARIADPEGELAVARAAASVGLPYTLSTLGTRSIEEIAAVSAGPKWFQVYVLRDRGLVKDLVERAKARGYEAHHPDRRHRRARPARAGRPPGLHAAAEDRPGHAPRRRAAPRLDVGLRAGRADRVRQRGRRGRGRRVATPVTLADYINAPVRPDAVVGRRRVAALDLGRPAASSRASRAWPTPSIAADAGVEAIALSNHGGRQLDTAPATLDLVEPVVQAVGDRLEVICDGGVRGGSDVVKAVALGAKAVMAGRAHLYGLGAGGERGVDHVLGLLDAGVRRTMALVGATTVDEITRDLLE